MSLQVAPPLRGALGLTGLLILGLAGLLYADGGVFAATKHGIPATGIERLTGPDYPRGSCIQCHYQHASAEGSPTGAANPYALFAANDNNLCGSPGCHADAGASHIYLGLAAYSQSAHATGASVVWPGPTPWARRISDEGKCINCHDPHGHADTSGLIPTLGIAREQALCLTCHDGSPAHTNVRAEMLKTYAHPALTVSGRHSVSEGNDFTRFGDGNRHAECEDCHNIHDLRHPTAPPTAPNASDRLRGVSYIEVVNGTAWTRPAYVFHPADDPTPVSGEYQLCFRCHSSWTTLPLTSPSGRPPTDKAQEFNPNNLSYHPVEAPGKQVSTVMDNGLLPPYASSSVIYCSDCHSSDSGAAPAGPHGSTNRYLLKRPYVTTEQRTEYTSSDAALCFACHSETALMDEEETNNQHTNFPRHKMHLRGASGTASLLPTCDSCHGNVHGSQKERLVDFSQEQHLTSFTSWTSKEAGAGVGQCTLVCHGQRHDRQEY